MITIVDSFKFAEVIIVVLGIAAYAVGDQIGQRLGTIGRLGLVLPAVGAIAWLQGSRLYADSWREVYIVGAIVLLASASIALTIAGSAAQRRNPNLSSG